MVRLVLPHVLDLWARGERDCGDERIETGIKERERDWRKMPGSLNYSPSGSEGGRSLGGGGGDLERSLVGVDLTTTPGKRTNEGGRQTDSQTDRERALRVRV